MAHLLQNEQSATNAICPSSGEASYRVTGDEFAAAISRIEARRAQESERASGQVDVEQTIRELRIDATSDEVMREVAAMRAEAESAEQARQRVAADKAEARRTRRRKLGWRALAAFGFVMFGSLLQYSTDQHNLAPPAAAQEIISHVTVPANAPVAPQPVLPAGSGRKLAKGQEIFLSTYGVQSLISSAGHELPHDVPFGATATDNFSWPVVRANETYYLYAYMTSSAVHSNHTTAEIYDESAPGKILVAIPLRSVVVVGAVYSNPYYNIISVTNLPRNLAHPTFGK